MTHNIGLNGRRPCGVPIAAAVQPRVVRQKRVGKAYGALAGGDLE